jgi:protein-S-isoprenylcysteine O-methyltransferase Ste14
VAEAATPESNHSGVRVPPPLVYAAGFGLGLGLHRLAPGDDLPASLRTVGLGLGVAGVAAALALCASALATFRRAGTSPVPVRPAMALVEAGPYRFTRNPMYLGLGVGYLGLALILDRAWTLLLLPAVLGVIRYHVIAREERYLESRFGPAYDAYRRRIPRWLGLPHH